MLGSERNNSERLSVEAWTTIHFGEQEKGVMLGKEDEGWDEYLMENLESLVQHKESMLETSEGTHKSHGFKTNNLCVYACYAGDGDGQS